MRNSNKIKTANQLLKANFKKYWMQTYSVKFIDKGTSNECIEIYSSSESFSLNVLRDVVSVCDLLGTIASVYNNKIVIK